jgi:hypothetical protein
MGEHPPIGNGCTGAVGGCIGDKHMDTLEKEAEELTAKVRVFLTRIAEETISKTDEPDLLDEGEISSLVERTLLGLSLERRVGLHTAVWVSDVEVYASTLARMAMNEKLKNATKSATPPRAGREF